MILEYLVPPRPTLKELGESSTAPDASSKHLSRLSRVSRRLRIHTRPYLYRQIILRRGRSLVLLFDVLASNQDLADHIRYIQWDMGLSISAVTKEVEDTFSSLERGKQELAEEGSLAKSEGAAKKRPQAEDLLLGRYPQYSVYKKILLAARNLEQLTIRESENEALFFFLLTLSLLHREQARSQTPWLSRLSTLQLAPAVSMSGGDTSQLLEYLSYLPSLQTLEVLHDSWAWLSAPTTTFPAIKNLTLHRSSATPHDIYRLCQFFPNLHNLTIAADPESATDRVTDSWKDDEVAYRGESLDAGLSMLAGTLRHLHLELNYLSSVDVDRLAGPDPEKSCLGRMRFLQTVNVKPSASLAAEAAEV